MLDAEAPYPICGDQYAARFMDERGLEIFRRFSSESRPNAGNVARHRYIDDLLRGDVEHDARQQIVLIGCGFDSRAFRLNGGTWYELDEPQLISYKNERLPAEQAPNPLVRIPIDFGADSLSEKLSTVPRNVPTVFVIEGVTMYVTAESLRSTLEVIRELFPAARVIADLMSRAFINRYGASIKHIIEQLGAQMIPGDAPALPFQQAGYHEVSSASVVGLSVRYRALGAVRGAFMRLTAPRMFSGYTVRVFAGAP
jgi:methyltransferase (TIGR00027 family)